MSGLMDGGDGGDDDDKEDEANEDWTLEDFAAAAAAPLVAEALV